MRRWRVECAPRLGQLQKPFELPTKAFTLELTSGFDRLVGAVWAAKLLKDRLFSASVTPKR
ncbi:MAG: hypothetical protein DMF89_22540 [Acidobacteria bacterium]|nr:MAG: hypothetical protein DMF89_22540 [Acidobacteriota bacterium]